MKKKIQVFSDLYESRLTVLVNCDWEAAQKTFHKMCGMYMSPGDNDGVCAPLGLNDYFVWVEEFDWTVAQQALLSHELLHYTFRLMRDIGMGLSESSEEAYTYFYQATMQEVWNKLKPKKK